MDCGQSDSAPNPVVEPRRILVCISGKRKSGKDFVAWKLRNALPELLRDAGVASPVRIDVVGISFSLKESFARIHGLDADRLKSDGGYKETVRREMVEYGERIRAEDPSYFCRFREALRSATKASQNDSFNRVHVIIVSDCRRLSDIAFFRYAATHNFNPECPPCDSNRELAETTQEFPGMLPIFIRIEATEVTRHTRGYSFVAGIDDAPTECSLDAQDDWDIRLRNDGDETLLCESLRQVAQLCASRLSSGH